MKFLLFVFLFFYSQLSLGFEVVAASSQLKPFKRGGNYINKVLLDAYKRVGVDAKLVELPSQRLLNGEIKGSFDALLARGSEDYLDKNYLKCDIPILSNLSVSLFFRKKTSLNGIKVGVTRGAFHNKTTKDFFKKHNVKLIESNDIETTIKMYLLGRIDAFLGSKIVVHKFMNKKLINMNELDSVLLFSHPIHHYVHKKHKAIFEKINKEYKRLDKLKKI